MDEHPIPTVESFPQKGPSFRMMPGTQQHNYGGSGNRSGGTTSGNQHRRNGYHQNSGAPPFLDDQRRMYSNGTGFQSRYHQQNHRSYYTDRFGRVHHENLVPVHYPSGYNKQNGQGYRQQQQFGNYGPFPHGVFTPPPNCISRGKGNSDQWMTQKQQNKELNEKIEKEEDVQDSNDSPKSSGDSGCSTLRGGDNLRDDISEASSVAGDDDILQDVEVDRQNRGPQQPIITTTQRELQQQQDVQFCHNNHDDFPDVKMKSTQYNDEYFRMSQNNYWNTRREIFQEEAIINDVLPPFIHNGPPRGFESRSFQHNHVYMEQGLGYPLQMETRPSNGGPLQSTARFMQHHQTVQLHVEHIHTIPNFHPMLLQYVNPVSTHNGTPFGLFEDSMVGFRQFQKDYGDQDSTKQQEQLHKVAHEQEDSREDFGINGGFHLFQSVKPLIEFKNVRLGVDGRDFIDTRKVRSFLRNGDREYKLFDNQSNPIGNILKEIYNRDLPVGAFTFTNLDKLVKGLDSSEPVLPNFAGPFAEWDDSWSSDRLDVRKGFKEYDLLFEAQHGDPIFGHIFGTNDKTCVKPRIRREMFKTFSIEIILYIFYTFTRDALQLLAAKEMYSRGWRFHKIYQVWMTPWISDVHGAGASRINDKGGWVSGVYKYFHYVKWQFYKNEFQINDSILEGEPPEVENELWEG